MQKKSSFKNPIIRWFDTRLPIFTLMQKEYGKFPTPKNLNYLWSFGAIAMFILGLMIITGVLLAMNYAPNTALAFNAVERITRDVNDGWMLRYLHMNGSHMFFVVVYIHLFRGLYYGSYKSPREVLWGFGVILLLLMMATAFMGYVLPWSQMSGWGATVITSLFSAFPVIGDGLVTWLWGGFSVDNPTLNRFFALHFLLPFIICGVVFLHVWALHVCGSNNPDGIEPKTAKDTISFHPYYTIKDFFAVGVFLILFSYLVFFAPDSLGHPDHYTPFNNMVTPAHIVPEWYFLPFYAILRSITFDVFFMEAKLIGVLTMFAAIGVLLLLPWLDRSPVRSARYRPLYRQFFWILVLSCVVLGYAGSQPATDFGPALAGQIATAYYFIHFLVILPLLSKFEKTLPLPDSIDDAMSKRSGKKS